MRHLMPDYWYMQKEYSPKWDKELNQLLDTYDFTDIGEYAAMLGQVTLWIANHPYASFTKYNGRFRPKRRTILRAYRKLMRDAEDI